VRYVSPDEDSGRWLGFPFPEGDIVISTRSKSGTTGGTWSARCWSSGPRTCPLPSWSCLP